MHQANKPKASEPCNAACCSFGVPPWQGVSVWEWMEVPWNYSTIFSLCFSLSLLGAQFGKMSCEKLKCEGAESRSGKDVKEFLDKIQVLNFGNTNMLSPTEFVFFNSIYIFYFIYLFIFSGFCHTLTRISHGFTCIPQVSF